MNLWEGGNLYLHDVDCSTDQSTDKEHPNLYLQTEQYSTKQNLQMPLCSTKESTLSILMVSHNKVLH